MKYPTSAAAAAAAPAAAAVVAEARVQRLVLRALAPIIHVSRIFGLAAFRVVGPSSAAEASVRPWPLLAAYSAALALLQACSSVMVIVHMVQMPAIGVVHSLVSATFIVKHVTATVVTACAVLKGGEMALALEKLVRLISRAARVPAVHARVCRRCRWAVAVVASQAALLVGAVAGLGYVFTRRRGNPAAVWELLALPAQFLANVQFIDVALLLQYALEAMNDTLASHFEPQSAWAEKAGVPLHSHSQVDVVSWIGLTRVKSAGSRRASVAEARALQRELRRAFFQMNDAFGFQSLLFVMVTFMQTTVSLYFLLVEGFNRWVTSVSTLQQLGQLLALLAVCQSTKDESRRTAVVVHRALLRGDLSEATRSELAAFSAQLQAAEMRFSAWGFFALDFALLQSFVGTVVTYIVIMVQFRGPSRPRGLTNNNTTAATAVTAATRPPSNSTTAFP